MGRKKRKGKASSWRRAAAIAGLAAVALLAVLVAAGEWFVHHPPSWIAEKRAAWPKILTAPLLWAGNPAADVTDGLGLTGHDAVYEYDEEAPAGSVFFAGEPRRVGEPAPTDIRILKRSEFVIGWSDSLRHPVWCAYHVVKEAKHDDGPRPGFTADRSVPAAPKPGDYTKSGYDRGHMVPNHAIISRYGEAARRLTFMMTNIAPQSPALNRGVWRDIEHRIADLWTARYGEIWVVVGCIPSRDGQKITGTGVDVPSAFYQLIVAQEGLDIRMLAVEFPQSVEWDGWAARHILTVNELEAITGLDFNPELPDFIQRPIEAERPTRLWPVRFRDIFSQILFRFN